MNRLSIQSATVADLQSLAREGGRIRYRDGELYVRPQRSRNLLNRAAEALKNAWEGTREARMSTLEAAKAAATKLGEAIEEGIALAKETWDPAKKPTDQVEETTADEEE